MLRNFLLLKAKGIQETFKLKLIRVLRHMHWEANLAHKVYNCNITYLC